MIVPSTDRFTASMSASVAPRLKVTRITCCGPSHGPGSEHLSPSDVVQDATNEPMALRSTNGDQRIETASPRRNRCAAGRYLVASVDDEIPQGRRLPNQRSFLRHDQAQCSGD